MRRALFILLGLLLAAACARPSTVKPTTPPSAGHVCQAGSCDSVQALLAPGDHTRTLGHDGRARPYIVHIPPGYNPAQPAPLVLVFHGGGGNAENAIEMTHFNRQSDQSGFIVVYPNGTGHFRDMLLSWNGGTCCGYARQQNVDDVGFVRDLLIDLQSVVNVDGKRIYATGISNGGIMSYRLACQAADLIAAIAPVAGTQNFSDCAPSEVVAVLHIHGTADNNLPYAGGIGMRSLSMVYYASVASSIAFWITADGCPTQAVSTTNGNIRHDVYAPCAEGSAVELTSILGGGHAWPGGVAAWIGGDQPAMEMDATSVIWKFFTAHPKP